VEYLEVMPITVFRFRPALIRFHTLNGVYVLDLFGKSLLVELICMVFCAQVCVERCVSSISGLRAKEEQDYTSQYIIYLSGSDIV
jgi:hypothetical protein